jgi:hypothetical protein
MRTEPKEEFGRDSTSTWRSSDESTERELHRRRQRTMPQVPPHLLTPPLKFPRPHQNPRNQSLSLSHSLPPTTTPSKELELATTAHDAYSSPPAQNLAQYSHSPKSRQPVSTRIVTQSALTGMSPDIWREQEGHWGDWDVRARV